MIGSRTTISAGLVTTLIAFLLDQGTKAFATVHLDVLREGVAVLPGFNLVFVRNTGVSFGMLGGMPMWSLSALGLAICAWLAVLMLRTQRFSEAVAYGMIVGGALGNVADRLRLGGVTDFLDFYIGQAHWPAFNLADTVIFIGVALLIFWPLLFPHSKTPTS